MLLRKIAVFTLMGNGHVNPVLPLIAELALRGYQVTCPTTARYMPRIRAAGGQPVEIAETAVDPALETENQLRAESQEYRAERFRVTELQWAHMVKTTMELAQQASEFYAKYRPDLIIYNRYCIPARIVAHRLNVPTIQFSPHFAYYGKSRFWDRGVGSIPEGILAYSKRLDGFLMTLGLSTEGNLWHLDRLNIHLIPREFQYRADLFDDRFWFAGNLYSQAAHPDFESARGEQPMVLISGYSGLPETRWSSRRHFRLFIDALGDTDFRCVLSLGGNLSAESLGHLPNNFEVSEDISHLELLKRATLFASHSGMGSTLEAISHGVPVLAIPATPYAEEVAYRLVDLQLGAALSTEVSAIEARRAVEAMIGDMALRHRVQAMSQVFRRSGGAATTVDRIESLLAEEPGGNSVQKVAPQG